MRRASKDDRPSDKLNSVNLLKIGSHMQPQHSASALVNPGFVRAMATYNAEMNRRIYGAVDRLSEEARRLPRGAFWGSIHGTLCHLLWGDRMWMARFDGWPKPTVAQRESATLIADFEELFRARIDADERISDWARRVTELWLAEEQVWSAACLRSWACVCLTYGER